MSLDWDITDCKNHEEVMLGTEIEGPKTEECIWGSIVVKLQDITEVNWKEWYARYKFWCQMIDQATELEPKDIHRRIGLSTNVFPDEPRSKWMNSLVKRELNRLVQNAEYQMNQLDNIEASEKIEMEKELVE